MLTRTLLVLSVSAVFRYSEYCGLSSVHLIVFDFAGALHRIMSMVQVKEGARVWESVARFALHWLSLTRRRKFAREQGVPSSMTRGVVGASVVMHTSLVGSRQAWGCLTDRTARTAKHYGLWEQERTVHSSRVPLSLDDDQKAISGNQEVGLPSRAARPAPRRPVELLLQTSGNIVPSWIVQRLNERPWMEESGLSLHVCHSDVEAQPPSAQPKHANASPVGPPKSYHQLAKDLGLRGGLGKMDDDDEEHQIELLERQLMEWHQEKLAFSRAKEELRGLESRGETVEAGNAEDLRNYIKVWHNLIMRSLQRN